LDSFGLAFFPTASVGFDGCFLKIHIRGFAMESAACSPQRRRPKIELQAIIGCKPSKPTGAVVKLARRHPAHLRREDLAAQVTQTVA
jgi:hypothetical protein